MSHNCTSKLVTPHQWGGTSLFSINRAAHRTTGKGIDASGLGRWCWTQYKGKKNHFLQSFSCYCPNPPNGPLSVYAQHRHHLLKHQDEICPRQAFIEDFCLAAKQALDEGDRLIIMLDGNSDMKGSNLSAALLNLNLHEALLYKYGTNGPSTFHRNKTKTPIDGIWISADMKILQGGYLQYDELIQNTDHCCLWLDIS